MVSLEASAERAFALAREQFARWGVDVDLALERLRAISISLHCWQGDDLGGFEGSREELGGGLAVTGQFPGKARTADELRSDLDRTLSLLPGSHRVNLHASYAETHGQRVERDALLPEHFQNWIDWAKSRRIGVDFNPTFFAHPLAQSGYTLAHVDTGISRFWIDHGIACRRIGAAIGKALGTPCITNVWIPDGSKDSPIDRVGPRRRLADALDAIFAEPIDARFNRDAVEGKLFGLGSESFVAGSHEFYFGYAASRRKLLCLDSGHFHPTEVVSDKISAVLLFLDEILLHVSRGVRWDSDHVVILSDELLSIAQELVRGDYLGRVHIGLDFFDASINRLAAWTIGARSMIKALLIALLEPTPMLGAARGRSGFDRPFSAPRRTEDAAGWGGLGPVLPDAGGSRRGSLPGGDQGVRTRGALETRLSHTARAGERVLSKLLELSLVSKAFAGVQALKRVSFDLRAGEVHALVGENGAGKSTLIKVITGAHVPDEGTLEIDNQPIENLDPLTAQKLGIAAIYQQPALFPDLTVAENIAIGLEGKGRPGASSAGKSGERGPAPCSNASARRSTRFARCARCRCPSSSSWRSRGPSVPMRGS